MLFRFGSCSVLVVNMPKRKRCRLLNSHRLTLQQYTKQFCLSRPSSLLHLSMGTKVSRAPSQDPREHIQASLEPIVDWESLSHCTKKITVPVESLPAKEDVQKSQIIVAVCSEVLLVEYYLSTKRCHRKSRSLSLQFSVLCKSHFP